MTKPRRETSLAYRQLWESFWDSPEWTLLQPGPPSARLLLIFLAVGPIQRSVPGVLLAGAGEIADHLGWSLQEVRDCIQQLETAGAVRVDLDARLIWLPWKYQHEVPANPDVVRGKGWRAVLERWPRGTLASTVHAFLRKEMVARGDAFASAFDTLPRPATVPPHGVPPPCPDTVSTHPGDHPGGTSTNQRSNESEIQRSADTSSDESSAHQETATSGQQPSPPSQRSFHSRAREATEERAQARKAEPTPQQTAERRQVREFWDAGFKQRCPDAVPIAWGSEGGKRHKLVIGLLSTCGGLVPATAHLQAYFARFDAEPFQKARGLVWEEAASVKCVEALRSARIAPPPPRSGQLEAGNPAPSVAETRERQRRTLEQLEQDRANRARVDQLAQTAIGGKP